MSMPVKVRVALAGLAVAGGGAVAAFLGPTGPAVGQSSPPIQEQVQLSSPASLVARGAGADVPVTVSCSGLVAEPAHVTVSLTERSASGVGSVAVNCTDTNQTFQVLVTPPFGRPLKKGTAIGNATINVCTVDFSFCANQTTQATIQVDG